MTKDNILSKIEAAMRVSKERGATEAEVKTAMLMVQRLMRKHNIDMAEVEDYGSEDGKSAQATVHDIVEVVVRSRANVVRFEVPILQAICMMTKTSCLIRHEGAKKMLVVYGLPQDCEIAKTIFTELIFIVRALARIELPGNWSKVQKDWCHGWGHGLYDQAAEELRRAENEVSSDNTSLIVLKDRLLQEYRAGLNVQPGKKPRVKLGASYQGGYDEGRKYRIARGKIS